MSTKVKANEKEVVTEKCSIVVVARDRYSTTVSCLETLIANTPNRYELIVVVGGASKRFRKELCVRFGQSAQFIFEERFLNPAEARNIGLRQAKQRLAILMDNDVYVRPNWLTPLLECQTETGVAMVVPIILEDDKVIHTAGNDFYVTYQKGRTFGHKVLRFHGIILDEKSNLKRQITDYGELHCQLVEVETTLKLGVFDEKLQEVGECDSGLTWAKAGCSMWFEPRSVVSYYIPQRVAAEDIKFFTWRWDMRLILEGCRHFEKKWGIDILEHGSFREFLLRLNNRVGFFPRIFPCKFVLEADYFFKNTWKTLMKLFFAPVSLWKRFRAWRLGYYEWLVANTLTSTTPIHIAYISHNSTMFGSEQSLLGIITALDKNRFIPHLITTKKGPLEEAVKDLGVSVSRFTWLAGVRFPHIFKWLQTIRRLAKWLSDHQIGIVELNLIGEIDLGILFLASRISGSKLIVRNRYNIKWISLYDKLWLSRVDQIVTVTNDTMESWLTPRRSDVLAKISMERVRLISSSRDIGALNAVRPARELLNEFGVPHDAKVIGMVAAINPIKRQDLFVEAAAIISKQERNMWFFIVGDTYAGRPLGVRYKEKIQQMIRDLNLTNRVILTGFRDDAAQLMKNFDVLVLPSEREAFGGTLVEAMALGIPVVASAKGGIPEVVEDGVTGILINDQNPEDYANAILKLLNHPELTDNLRHSAKEHAKKFDNRQVCQLLEQCYDEVMSHD